MAWNQPGNNGQDRDPWGSSNNNGGNSSGNNKGGSNRGATDLDDLFRKLSQKLGGLGRNKGGDGSEQNSKFGGRLIGLAVAAAVVVWVVSGFYTIKETERGVVTRLGKFSHVVQPGLNWKMTFIDQVRAVNVESVRDLATSGAMLTSDENVVVAEMNVQYRVTDPAAYLFNVTNPDNSLRQATDSAVRGVVGKHTMETNLTEGRTVVRNDTQKVLEETIRPYNMGITVVDVNFQTARPPEEVKVAFDDVIAAREQKQQTIREARAYENEVLPKANGEAQRIIEDARAYKVSSVLNAKGEVASFAKILPEYKAAPEITRERLYIETMERVLSTTRKIIANEKSNNVLLLPLDQAVNDQAQVQQKASNSAAIKKVIHQSQSTQRPESNTYNSSNNSRDDTTRVGRP
ncbi:FtsH protease activity modulator HflK [Xenorhabdus anantnagensis]|uniref:Protein HflK n=1 Tax=Xenorhabdus anantnagensis TaxID=3025875 RepID=A0ABT5LT68_9GAMM|nr:FtsH protease activity modulator HflK [Xenorhabdus anantnagensis]MDC9596973.1 FtsH protease activity modulator HflK [Xenorhabdus anantnagensis]